MNANELGATAALARANRDPEEIAPTVYTLALATSAVLTAAMFASAPAVATLAGDPAATPVIQAMSLAVLLGGLCSVPSAMMWREFRQQRRLAADLSATVMTSALAFPMALAGWGAMALAWSRVGGVALGTVLYIVLEPTRFRPGWRVAEVGPLLRLGVPLAAANVVVFATLNVDYVVVGRESGPAEVGVYLLAFTIASLPTSLITQVVRTVAVPALGRLHLSGELADRTPETLASVALLAFPVSGLLGGLAASLLSVAYGPTYAAGAAALVGLSVFGAARVVTEVLSDISLAAGRTGALLWVQVLWFIFLVPSMVVGVRWWGIAGAGIAHAAVVLAVVVPVYLLVVRSATGTSPRRLLAAMAPAAACSLVAGLVAWGVSTNLAEPLGGLLLGGLGGAAAYLLLARRHVLRLFGFVLGRSHARDRVPPSVEEARP
jgi:PST family polysaccharide transporter